jgi:hypothetical protein
MFTAEEEKELTNFNGAAFDLVRTIAVIKKQKISPWLYARADMRQVARSLFHQWMENRFQTKLQIEELEIKINSMNGGIAVSNWIKLEAECKALRNKGAFKGYWI